MSKDWVVCAETASEVGQWHRSRVGSKRLQKRKLGVIARLVLVMVPFTELQVLQWARWGQGLTP